MSTTRREAVAKRAEPPREHRGDRTPRWALVAACLLLGPSLAACKDKKTTPEANLRTFLSQVYAHQGKQAWQGLSKGSQDALRADAEALARAAGDAKVETDADDLLFMQADLTLLAKPDSISVVSPLGGDEVLLRVTVEEGPSANIRMVREGRSWKVDLVGSLEKMKFEAPKPTQSSTTTAVEDLAPEAAE